MCPPLIIPLMGALSTGSSAIGLTGAAAAFDAIGITVAAGGLGAGASTAASIAGSAIAGAGAGNLLLAGATVAQGVQARQQAQFQAEVA